MAVRAGGFEWSVSMRFSGWLLLVSLSFVLAGCADKKAGPTKSAGTKSGSKGSAKAEEHNHGKGPSGGVVFDLGKYHAEFTADHAAKECAVNFIAGEDHNAKPLFVGATELTVSTKETKTADGKVVAPMTIKLLPKDTKDGKASKFVGTDAGLGNVAEFAGTVLGEVDGKPAKGEFKE